jgi:hypothetical protein
MIEKNKYESWHTPTFLGTSGRSSYKSTLIREKYKKQKKIYRCCSKPKGNKNKFIHGRCCTYPMVYKRLNNSFLDKKECLFN